MWIIALYRKLVNFVSEGSTVDKNQTVSQLSNLILHTVFSANKANFQAQLKLALAWNRIDVAESEIFTEDTKRDKFRVSFLLE